MPRRSVRGSARPVVTLSASQRLTEGEPVSARGQRGEHEIRELQRDQYEQNERRGVPGLIGQHVRRLRELAGRGDEKNHGGDEVRGEMNRGRRRVALAEAAARLQRRARQQRRGDERRECEVRRGDERQQWPCTGHQCRETEGQFDGAEEADERGAARAAAWPAARRPSAPDDGS